MGAHETSMGVVLALLSVLLIPAAYSKPPMLDHYNPCADAALRVGGIGVKPGSQLSAANSFGIGGELFGRGMMREVRQCWRHVLRPDTVNPRMKAILPDGRRVTSPTPTLPGPSASVIKAVKTGLRLLHQSPWDRRDLADLDSLAPAPITEGYGRPIQVCDSGLEQGVLQSATELFDKSLDAVAGTVFNGSQMTVQPQLKSTLELGTATQSDPRWHLLEDVFRSAMMRCLRGYMLSAARFVPHRRHTFSDEGWRVKKYDNVTGGHHTWHHDSSSPTRNPRALAFVLYLNTVPEGGATHFKIGGEQAVTKVVRATRGNLVLFPTTSEFLHHSERPWIQSKYVAVNFLTINT